MTTVSAKDVAAALRERLPGIGTKKLHKLLYYCQGHHLAAFNEPLFTETISAYDMGPIVGTVWYAEKETGIPASSEAAHLGEAALNTVGYVVSRYGALSGNDLEHLTHSEHPWQEANVRRIPGTSVRIPAERIAAYFRRAEADEDDQETLLPDVDEVTDWLSDAHRRQRGSGRPDTVEEIRARLRVSA